MNGIELLQTLVNLYNEAVMNGVKSDSWTTKLDSLNLANSARRTCQGRIKHDA